MAQGFDFDAAAATRKALAPPPSVAQKAAQSRTNRDAGGDIPPTSPLGAEGSTPGFLESARKSFGIPSTMAELKGMLPGMMLNMTPYGPLVDSANTAMRLAGAHNAAQVGQALSPNTAMFGQQLGEGNFSGALGTASPVITSLALGALGSFLPEPAGPPTGTPILSEPPVAGPMRSGLSALSREALPGALDRVAQAFLKTKPKTIGYNMGQGEFGPPAPPPTLTAPETLAATDPNQLPQIQGTGLSKPRPATPVPLPKSFPKRASTAPPAGEIVSVDKGSSTAFLKMPGGKQLIPVSFDDLPKWGFPKPKQ